MSDDPNTVKFFYVKSPQCRDVHVSGMFGGMNQTTGDLHISVFAERPPIPNVINFELGDDGTLGAEVAREGKDGMVRVVQDTLYMDLPTALSFHQWLTGHIEKFAAAHPELALHDQA